MKKLTRVLLISWIAMFSITTLADQKEPHPIIVEIYDAFQKGELDRWDEVMHPEVITNSSASFGNKGIDKLKTWAGAFLTAFAPRIDLVDFINAIDDSGNGRAVATINLNWKHVESFFGVLAPTRRTGTSIENLILTLEDGKVTRIEVADTTLDLVIYMHENGWVFPQNIRPTAIIKGIERSVEQNEISFK